MQWIMAGPTDTANPSQCSAMVPLLVEDAIRKRSYFLQQIPKQLYGTVVCSVHVLPWLCTFLPVALVSTHIPKMGSCQVCWHLFISTSESSGWIQAKLMGMWNRIGYREISWIMRLMICFESRHGLDGLIFPNHMGYTSHLTNSPRMKIREKWGAQGPELGCKATKQQSELQTL